MCAQEAPLTVVHAIWFGRRARSFRRGELLLVRLAVDGCYAILFRGGIIARFLFVGLIVFSWLGRRDVVNARGLYTSILRQKRICIGGKFARSIRINTTVLLIRTGPSRSHVRCRGTSGAPLWLLGGAWSGPSRQRILLRRIYPPPLGWGVFTIHICSLVDATLILERLEEIEDTLPGEKIHIFNQTGPGQ